MLKDNINKAYEFAKKAHEGQMRKYSSLPYFTHPKNVARIVEELTGDEDLIIAALLHDCVEDTDVSNLDIHKKFGEEIASLVLRVTLQDSVDKSTQIKFAILCNGYGSAVIKLADRYHNLKYLNKDIQSKQHLKFIKKYYYATKEIFTQEVLDKDDYEKYNDAIRLLKKMIMNQLEYLRIQFNFD